MKLFYRQIGSGEPLIILHGLYGSSDNWLSVARPLSGNFTVFMPDLRNHGHSPHSAEQNYGVMSDDIAEFMAMNKIGPANFIGHSMGGKVAFTFGLSHPGMVRKMIMVDITPLQYDLAASEEGKLHSLIAEGLLAINPEKLTGRQQADRILGEYIKSVTIRQFLLKNLRRGKEGRFYWGMNVPVLIGSLQGIFEGISRDVDAGHIQTTSFPMLFIRGEKSDYISPQDEKTTCSFWPSSRIVTIKNAGHWVHFEQPQAFLEAAMGFFTS